MEELFLNNLLKKFTFEIYNYENKIEDNKILKLHEIQIIPEYQGKYKIFKMLLQHLPCLNNIDKIKCTIKDDNIHSIECFKNIGMTNKNDFWYQMDYKIFLSNINKGLIN